MKEFLSNLPRGKFDYKKYPKDRGKKMSRIEQLGRNYRFLALNNIITILISFFLFPFIVSYVGKELYGTYLLGMTISGYFGTFDLGVLSAVKKYIPEYRGRNDTEGLQGIINASFSFYIVFGLIAGAILYSLGFWGPGLFKISSANVMVMRYLFWIFAVSAIFHWPLQVFKGVIQGFQRYDWLAGLDTVIQIGYLLGAYFLLTRGFRIVSIAILFQSLVVGTDFIFFLLTRLYIKGLKLKFPYFHRDVFKKIFSFSIFVFLGGIVSILIWNIGDFIIGVFVSVAAVTVYKVSYAMQNIIRSVNSLIGSPLMTLCAEMEGAGEYEKQQQLLLKGTRYMTLLIWPVIVIAMVFSEVFILNWVGEGFRDAIIPARLLLFFWLFNVAIEVGGSSLTAKGIVRPVFWIAVISAICNLALSLIFVRFLGILGVALGMSISMILVSFPMVFSLILENIKVGFGRLFNFSIRSSLIISLMSAVISTIVIKFIQPSNIYWVLVEMACIYLLIILCDYFFVLSPDEKDEIKKMFALEE